MAEDLTEYLRDAGIRVRYLHSDIDTLERAQIIRDMRLDVFDVLVGINLLREGLDIPEIALVAILDADKEGFCLLYTSRNPSLSASKIALVAILDADKEGFLRSETSLIQTIGRAARNSEGHVVTVSYTHLDVYKRQISAAMTRGILLRDWQRMVLR